jgi:flagellar basal-body rod protein FlgB
MSLAGPENELILRLLSASSLRARVIAGNLSNQNTPGYLRRVVRFEELLARALERGGRGSLAGVEPLVAVDEQRAPGPDGNNVSMEVEVNAMRENQLLYDLYASILATRTRLIEHSIAGGR